MPFDHLTRKFDAVGGSALEKAIAVLSVVTRAERPMGFSELAAELELSRQAVHRIASQMESLGLVRRVPGREGIVVGPGIVELGLNALQSSARMAEVRVILRDLVSSVGETCNIGVLDRDEVVYVERVECDWPLRLQYGAGSRVPIHASAIGKLLMAHLPARTRRRILSAGPLAQLTPSTLSNPDILETQFKVIRKQGYAVNDQENVIGLMGLAVPILDQESRVAAAVSVQAPVARMDAIKAVSHVPRFQDAARRLSDCFQSMMLNAPKGDV